MDDAIIKLTLFAVGTGALLFISRKSLRVVESHGFDRFFAWEFILALILVNSSAWFHNPLSVQQIVSWIILVYSLFVLIQGVWSFRLGKSNEGRQDETLLTFEKTTNLVTSGIYHYIRHPMYASLLFLAWGAFLKDITWYSVCLVIASTFSLVTTARKDERECVHYFGSAYEEYMTRTKMFVPLLF